MSTEPTVIRTHGGGEVRVSDSSPFVVVRSPEGASIEMHRDQMRIQGYGVEIMLQGGTVTIRGGRIALEAAIVKAGVIQCDTIIATSVVGTNYTPGAGNVW